MIINCCYDHDSQAQLSTEVERLVFKTHSWNGGNSQRRGREISQLTLATVPLLLGLSAHTVLYFFPKCFEIFNYSILKYIWKGTWIDLMPLFRTDFAPFRAPTCGRRHRVFLLGMEVWEGEAGIKKLLKQNRRGGRRGEGSLGGNHNNQRWLCPPLLCGILCQSGVFQILK